MSAYNVSVGNVRWNKHRGNFILGWELLYADGSKPAKFSTSCDQEPPLLVLRTQLLDAARRGLAFDTARKGLPAGVERPAPKTDPAIAQAEQDAANAPALVAAAKRLQADWADRMGNTTRADLDGLVMTFEAMLRPDAPTLEPPQRATLREYLREALTPPDVLERLARVRAEADAKHQAKRRPVEQWTREQAWRYARTDADRAKRRADRLGRLASAEEFYAAHGLRWDELDEAAALRVVARLRRKTDGAPAGHNTVARRLITCNALFDWAARKDHTVLTENPIRMLEKKQRPSTSIKIRPVELRRVQSFATILRILEVCEELGQADPLAALLVPYFALSGLAGLRPSESRALLSSDISLPATDAEWGTLVLHGSICTVGARHTADGSTDLAGGLKWRDTDAERVVAIPPHLVTLLRRHLSAYGRSQDEPVFLNADGTLVTTSDIHKVWHAIRNVVFDGQPELQKHYDVYDLRHARLSHILAQKDVDEAYVAAQAGNSVHTLRATYQGPIAAGENGSFAADLKLYVDEIVPPDLQRLRGPSWEMLEARDRKFLQIAMSVVTGDITDTTELLQTVTQPRVAPVRTVAAARKAAREAA